MRFRELKLRKNPDCVVCGPNPTVTKLIDYEAVLRHPAGGGGTPASGVPEITVEDLKAMRDRGDDFVLVDVREPHEFAICALPGFGQDPARDPAGEPEPPVDRGRDRRPLQAAAAPGRAAARGGLPQGRNLAGGIDRWADRSTRRCRGTERHGQCDRRPTGRSVWTQFSPSSECSRPFSRIPSRPQGLLPGPVGRAYSAG